MSKNGLLVVVDPDNGRTFSFDVVGNGLHLDSVIVSGWHDDGISFKNLIGSMESEFDLDIEACCVYYCESVVSLVIEEASTLKIKVV